MIALSASLSPNVGKSLMPVTWTRQRAPIEPAGMTKVFSVASAMSLQVCGRVPVQRCHWYSYSIVSVPVHVPSLAVRSWPTGGLPADRRDRRC